MSGTISASPSSATPTVSTPTLAAAWVVVAALTVPEIVLRGFLGWDTSWMLPGRIGLLVVLLVVTGFSTSIRPLRGFFIVLLVIYAGEGLLFGTVIAQSGLYLDVVGDDAYAQFLGERVLRIGAVVVMIAVLLLMGLKPREFYLTLGNPRAISERDPFLRLPPKAQPWTKFGRNYAIISTAILLAFLLPAVQPSLAALTPGLIGFAAGCALINSFAEEFLYRAALLPQLVRQFPPQHVLLRVAVWFGLSHYFGVPSGISGVILTAIGGWFFAKSMMETRGMAVPWFLHFLSDFAVYTVILLAGVLDN
ncbi:MAG: CPBP family intramembrane glutamic endopeptidase [Pseudolysinimonas sp.]